jgi:hypothetical protein
MGDSATGGFKGRRSPSLISSDPSNGYRIAFLYCELDTHEGRSYNSPCLFVNIIKYKDTNINIRKSNRRYLLRGICD